MSPKFKFLNYHIDFLNFSATFNYEGADGTKYSEHIQFAKPLSDAPADITKLDRAAFLAFILIGTSYYKAHPTKEIELNIPIDEFQANFFNAVFQEGLSQYAFENKLKRGDLAHFVPTTTSPQPAGEPEKVVNNPRVLILQSGGKDSLLTSELVTEPWSSLYLGSHDKHPKVLDGQNLQTAVRSIDMEGLKIAELSGGKNGHVPVTYIVQSIALMQAIFNHQTIILTSIGHEGAEAHAYIDDLKVNHQWSKTWEAETEFAKYVKRYVAPDIKIGSILRQYSELKIAELFTEKCWDKYADKFSSCNVANYRQKNNNETLTWCGHCAKCANSYLLFAPFVEKSELIKLFDGKDLFNEPDLIEEFKGLLGIGDYMKPFECIGEIEELRKAYSMKKPEFANLPFDVPATDYDYEQEYDHQTVL